MAEDGTKSYTLLDCYRTENEPVPSIARCFDLQPRDFRRLASDPQPQWLSPEIGYTTFKTSTTQGRPWKLAQGDVKLNSDPVLSDSDRTGDLDESVYDTPMIVPNMKSEEETQPVMYFFGHQDEDISKHEDLRNTSVHLRMTARPSANEW